MNMQRRDLAAPGEGSLRRVRLINRRREVRGGGALKHEEFDKGIGSAGHLLRRVLARKQYGPLGYYRFGSIMTTPVGGAVFIVVSAVGACARLRVAVMSLSGCRVPAEIMFIICG